MERDSFEKLAKDIAVRKEIIADLKTNYHDIFKFDS